MCHLRDKIRYPVRKIVHINSTQNWDFEYKFFMSIYLYMCFLIIRINNGGSIDHLIVGQRVSWVWVRSGGSPNVPTRFKWLTKGSESLVIDLFKSLVVLWIVNTVNELIHLRHIIHQNPLYVPICP